MIQDIIQVKLSIIGAEYDALTSRRERLDMASTDGTLRIWD